MLRRVDVKVGLKKSLGKVWYFIWYDDSLASWLVNLVIAFVLVKFLIYPGMGFFLGTEFPIVAVVSGSMEHNPDDFDGWWDKRGVWYEDNGVGKKDFESFKFKNGFNKGDIMFLKGIEPKHIKVGDVLVYETGAHNNPIIHRVVGIDIGEGVYYFLTKGDNNHKEDKPVIEEQIVNTGKAVFKIPYLGWVKIWFVDVFGLN